MPQDVGSQIDVSLLVDGQEANASDVTIPIGDLVDVINNILNGAQLAEILWFLEQSSDAPLPGSQQWRLYFKSNGLFYRSSAAIREVVNTAQAQTLTNKTLNFAAMNNPTVSGGTFNSPTVNTPGITGGTMSGNAVSGGSINNTPIGATTPNTGYFSELRIPDTGANNKYFRWYHNNVQRWAMLKDAVAANLQLERYNSSGVFQENTLLIENATGKITAAKDFHVGGTLTKFAGTFDIPHPVAVGKRLIHSFIEGPQGDLIYRGKATLECGKAVVNIDDYFGMTPGTFAALTQHVVADVFLQNISGWEPLRGSLRGGELFIECRDKTSGNTVSWMVVAERNDPGWRESDLTDWSGCLIVEKEIQA